MAFDAFDLLMAIEAAVTLLGAGDHTLRVQNPGGRLCGMAVSFANPARQRGTGLTPDALGPEAIIPGAHRLVWTEVGRQRAPWTTRVLEVKTRIHHLAHIGREGPVPHEQRFDNLPFRVRQVTGVTPSVIFVFFSIFIGPHLNLLSPIPNSWREDLVKQALKGLDFEMKPGERLVVIGPSGGGKSTLLRVMMGLEKISKGTVTFGGRPYISAENSGQKTIIDHQIRREIGMVFQHYTLFPHLNILQNMILAPCKVRGETKRAASDR